MCCCCRVLSWSAGCCNGKIFVTNQQINTHNHHHTVSYTGKEKSNYCKLCRQFLPTKQLERHNCRSTAKQCIIKCAYSCPSNITHQRRAYILVLLFVALVNSATNIHWCVQCVITQRRHLWRSWITSRHSTLVRSAQRVLLYSQTWIMLINITMLWTVTWSTT